MAITTRGWSTDIQDWYSPDEEEARFMPEGQVLEFKDAAIAQGKAIARIRELYHAGTPLFTKEAIRHIQKQIESTKRGDTITIRGIDGVDVEYEVETGRIIAERNEPDYDMVVSKPEIKWRDLQYLTSNWSNGDSRRAFCSMGIGYTLEKHDKSTKKFFDFPRRSLEGVEQSFEETLEDWEETVSFQKLKTMFEAIPTANVSKVVTFALSTMAHAAGDQEPFRRRPQYQHAMALGLRALIEKKAGKSIPCYAQDPIYTDIDKTVLKQHGVTVVDDPYGFLEVDDSTLVISIAPNVPVKSVLTEIARPPIMILNPVDMSKQGDATDETLSTDPDSPRVRSMIKKDYEPHLFPADIQHFGFLEVYVRRENVPSHDTQSHSTSAL